ncbi:sodium:solute symporter family transporter [Streptomyces peucetius]|uniref:Integral membrane protein n=1 Tax=Streptomyces peucetius TaxID=1950 RepID=A0ABY6IJ89_STRPE|nr:hypothetical protein [Streptomyces peucetius]UYQ66225.1 hypothetical protein OGH68_35425 [Streptomyces peucetius]
MSTADSYLNSTAVAFTKDIYVPLLRPAASDRRRLLVQRLVTLVVGVAVVIFALSAPSIIDALLLTYNLWAPTVVVPLVAGVVFGLRSRIAEVVSIVAGGTAMSMWLWGLNEPFGITALIVGVAVNIVAYALAYAFGSRHDRLDLAADVDLRVDPEPAPALAQEGN